MQRPLASRPVGVRALPGHRVRRPSIACRFCPASWARAAREREPRPRCFLPLGPRQLLCPKARGPERPCSGSPFQGRGPHAPFQPAHCRGARPSPRPWPGPAPAPVSPRGRGRRAAGRDIRPRSLAAPARCPLPADRFGAASREWATPRAPGASSQRSSPRSLPGSAGPSPRARPQPEPASQTALGSAWPTQAPAPGARCSPAR